MAPRGQKSERRLATSSRDNYEANWNRWTGPRIESGWRSDKKTHTFLAQKLAELEQLKTKKYYMRIFLFKALSNNDGQADLVKAQTSSPNWP